MSAGRRRLGRRSRTGAIYRLFLCHAEQDAVDLRFPERSDTRQPGPPSRERLQRGVSAARQEGSRQSGRPQHAGAPHRFLHGVHHQGWRDRGDEGRHLVCRHGGCREELPGRGSRPHLRPGSPPGQGAMAAGAEPRERRGRNGGRADHLLHGALPHDDRPSAVC